MHRVSPTSFIKIVPPNVIIINMQLENQTNHKYVIRTIEKSFDVRQIIYVVKQISCCKIHKICLLRTNLFLFF